MWKKVRATWEFVDLLFVVGLCIASLCIGFAAIAQGDTTKAAAFLGLAFALSAHFRIDNKESQSK